MKIAFFSFLCGLLLLSGCAKKPPIPNTPGAGVVSFSFFSADIGGSISGINIIDKGVCWGVKENPDLEGNYISAGDGSEPFEVTLTGLSSKTKYYVRTYATNESGTVFSNNITFTTTPAIGLTTNSVTSISSNSAICGGLLDNTASTFTPTERGICWNTSANPLVTHNKSISSSSAFSFTAALNNLNANTVYYAKAYASSNVGIVYGTEVSFRTFGDPVTDVDGNTYNTVAIGTQIWMVENLKVTKYRNGDNIPYILSNLSWSQNSLDGYGYQLNSSSSQSKYGNLYNYLTVSDSRKLAPTGWHIPSKPEWETLIDYLGGLNVAALKLMSELDTDWPNYWYNSTNESRFKAIAGGYRDSGGGDLNLGDDACFWANTTAGVEIYMMSITATGPNSSVSFQGMPKKSGFSVRCIKD